MKRSTLWVTLAATGVQLAALGLCAWAMQSSRDGNRALAKPRPADALVPIAPVVPVAPLPTAASEAPVAAAVAPEPISIEIASHTSAVSPPIVEPAPVPVVITPIIVEPVADEPTALEPLAAVAPVAADEPAEVAPYSSAIEIAPAVDPLDAMPDIWADPTTPAAWSPPPAEPASPPVESPVTAAPAPPVVARTPLLPDAPARAIPRFITNFADDQTQIVVAEEGDPPLVFGIFADGNVRCVDVDNGCYAGKAEGERSRMREVAGSRAFTVQLEPQEDGSFTASFVGGLHDAQHLTLLPVVIAGRA